MAWAVPLVFWRGLEDVEVHLAAWTDLQDTRRVSAAVTVVRRRPDRNNRVLREVVLFVSKQRKNWHSKLKEHTL